ncbi:hypothetical protein ACFPM3_23030 [Streptomyces coeruleoprunus]|uniref:Secreted protein n=1 Tax=Streptomyces coeruleoprunus TaxID=285563 RepID=A0ABV9XLG7_9ACTN
MSTGVKIAGFVLALAAVFGVAYAAGGVLDPFVATPSSEAPATAPHTGAAH